MAETEPIRRVVIVDSLDVMHRGETLFPGATVKWANGGLDFEPANYNDAVIISTDRERIEQFCAAFVAVQCAKVRFWEQDLSGFTERQQVLDAAAGIKPYVPGSARQTVAAHAGTPPLAAVSPLSAGLEPVEPVEIEKKAENAQIYTGSSGSPDEPLQNAPEPPAIELPPLEAYADQASVKHAPKARKRPRLAAVDGNLARAPDPEQEPLPQQLSEDFLAEHFVSKHGEDWKFVRKWFQWFRWDGDGWREDVTGEVNTLAIAVTREALTWPEAASLTPKEKRLVNRRAVAGSVRELACDHRTIAAVMEQWDADTMLLGCPGGVLDLKSGKMLEAERGQYITKRCAVAPANGPPVLWLKFLDTVCGGDESLIAYLQRFAGYAMTGETTEHSLVFCHGTGANGKTVFLHTLSGILGDYAISAGIETFTETKNERHSTEIARLRGARLVVTEETDAGGRWAEGKIKRLTGGGKISAHFMRQDDFEFIPQFKLLIASNHKPMLRSTDEAIRRRFHMVPFAVTIPVEDRDHGLMEKLTREWPQILGWMLDGCVAWQECGLGLPEAIQNATDAYLTSEDVLGQWLDECCERDKQCESSILYSQYSSWCERQGERAWSRRAWANALVDRGFGTGKVNGARGIIGLCLRPGAQTQPPSYSRD